MLPLLAELFQVSIDDMFGNNSAGLRRGLAAEYLFNGDAQDSSGNERHGKVEGATLCKNRFDKPNSAYYFNGKTDYIVVDPAPDLNREAFSLSVWCRYDENAKLHGWNNAIVSRDSIHPRSLQLSTRENHIVFHRFLHEPDLVMEQPLHKGFWYHIVVTYADRTFKLYRNGTLISEQPGSFTVNDGEPLYIGRKSSDEPYFFFHGTIDDLRLYNRTLSEDEVKELYLENGWVPVKEPEAEVADDDNSPVLSRVSSISIHVGQKDIQAAVEWYIRYLGFFPLHMDPDRQLYFLRLHEEPNLIVRCTDANDRVMEPTTDKEDMRKPAPFIFATKRNIRTLHGQMTDAGALVQEVKDIGFGYLLNFQDPFGHNWCILREKINSGE